MTNASGLGTLNGNMYFTAGTFAAGHEIRWHLDSGSSAYSNLSFVTTKAFPVYRAIIGRGLVTPPVSETIDVRVELGRPDKRGGRSRGANLEATELRLMAEGSAPVSLYDLNGNTQWVKVIGPIEEEEYWQQAGDSSNQSGSFEVIAGFKMAILSFSSGVNP